MEELYRLKIRKHDLVGSIEAAYNIDADDEPWLQGLLQSIHPALDQGGGMIGYLYDGSGENLRIWGYTGFGAPAPVMENAQPAVEGLTPAVLHQMLLGYPRVMSSASQFLGTERTREYVAANPGLPFGDTVGIKCHEPEGWGAMLGMPVPAITQVDRATEAPWARLAAHVTTALRIRRRLRGDPAVAAPDAVLSARGTVSHAEESAKSVAARESLSSAVRAREAARGKLRRTDPEEAADLWKALVDGRWSLLDQHDADGRRWVLARKNAPASVESARVTPREQQVLGYVALGHSNKLIAYTLGLSVAAVGNLVARGARKLGVKSRVELIEQLNGTTWREDGTG